jgi:hypothetical protein
MGCSIESGYCMARDWLRPDLFFSLLNVLCDLFDVGFYLFFFLTFCLLMVPDLLILVTLCLWMPPIAQGTLLFGAVAPAYLLVAYPNPLLPWPRLDLWPGCDWLLWLLGLCVVPSLAWMALPVWVCGLLFLLFCLIDWMCPWPREPYKRRRRRRRHKSKSRYHWIHRRKLPFHAAMQCHCLALADGFRISTTGPVILRRWRRRRNLKARAQMKLCQKHHHSAFLKSVAAPHVLSSSLISDDALDEFIKNQGNFFLGLPKLMRKLDVKQHLDNATQAFS